MYERGDQERPPETIVGLVNPPTIDGMPEPNNNVYLKALFKTSEMQRNVALAAVGVLTAKYEQLKDQYEQHVQRLLMELSRVNSELANAKRELSEQKPNDTVIIADNVTEKPKPKSTPARIRQRVRKG